MPHTPLPQPSLPDELPRGLPPALLRDLTAVVGPRHVLTGGAAAGYAVDWTGRFRGDPPAVLRPRDAEQVAALLRLCSGAGVPVSQGGNTGLVGGSVPVHGEVVLSLSRLDRLRPADLEAAQVTAGAGVTLSQAAAAAPSLDLGVLIASRDSATVGGAVATNAGGLRVLRYGPMRAQLRGIEAVLADGSVLSHLSGLVMTTPDTTTRRCWSLEGTLASSPRPGCGWSPGPGTSSPCQCGLPGLGELHALARLAADRSPACSQPSSSPPQGWMSWPPTLAWHRRWPSRPRRISCWRGAAWAPWTIWPRWLMSIPWPWRRRRRTGPGCGSTGNASRKRRLLGVLSNWTSPGPRRTGPNWRLRG